MVYKQNYNIIFQTEKKYNLAEALFAEAITRLYFFNRFDYSRQYKKSLDHFYLNVDKSYGEITIDFINTLIKMETFQGTEIPFPNQKKNKNFLLNLLTNAKKRDTMGTAKAQHKKTKGVKLMTKFRIQTEIMNIGINEIEIFTDEKTAKERFDSLVQSAKNSGLDIEIIFDIIKK